jgi:hypothetical protein
MYDANNQASAQAAQQQAQANATAASQANQAAGDAWDKLEGIRKEAEKLRDTWEDDAKTCADALKSAADEAPTESFLGSLGGMFDDLGGWFKDHLGDIGDIAGIVSAVAGALAFIPVLTPIAGPVAIGAGAIALAAHGADMVVNDKWDDPNAWVSLGGDVVGIIPGVGALSKGFNAAGDAIADVDRLVDVTRATGATGMIDTAGEAIYKGATTVGSEMSSPSKAFEWVAQRAIGPSALLAPEMTTNVAKALEGGTSVALQIPSGIGLVDTSDQATGAKNASGTAGAILAGITTFVKPRWVF